MNHLYYIETKIGGTKHYFDGFSTLDEGNTVKVIVWNIHPFMARGYITKNGAKINRGLIAAFDNRTKTRIKPINKELIKKLTKEFVSYQLNHYL